MADSYTVKRIVDGVEKTFNVGGVASQDAADALVAKLYDGTAPLVKRISVGDGKTKPDFTIDASEETKPAEPAGETAFDVPPWDTPTREEGGAE